MSLNTLPAEPKPDTPSTTNEQPRILTAAFNDGYEQRAEDGLNANLINYGVSWTRISVAEKDVLVTFFRNQKGAIPFWYTIPGESTPRKFIASRWDTSAISGLIWWTVVAQFREVPDFIGDA